MARIIDSASIDSRTITELTTDEQLWAYNGLDAAITREIHNKISPMANEHAKRIYNFVIAMQAPAFDMMLRGFKIDLDLRGELVQRLQLRHDRLKAQLIRLVCEGFDWPAFNPGSPHQLKKLFYFTMKLPVQYKYDKVKKERVPSTDREALEKLLPYFYAQPLVGMILALRDLKKKIEVLTTNVDIDNRMRCSYNITGTKFGRWSSSSNAFGSGSNLQNVTDEMREIFIPDEGMKIAYADLEQAESVCVAYVSNDQNYKNAIKSGDLHTYVCRMIFPNLPWTGDIKKDKVIAQRPYYRQFDHRDIAKRGGHLTNYWGKPITMSQRLRLPTAMCEQFQADYLTQFHGIKEWHGTVSRKIAANSNLVTLLGRQIWFFDRTDSDDTIRQAIASEPQSLTGDILNLGLYRTWELSLTHRPILQLLGQVHDAIVFQYHPAYELYILPKVLEAMTIPVPVEGQGDMIIKTEVSVGWNWRKRVVNKDGTVTNPFGIMKWTPGERDKREAPAAKGTGLLDRRVRSAYKPLLVA